MTLPSLAHQYVIALGSNRRGRHGAPAAEVAAALAAVGGVVAQSPVVTTAPVGPSSRRFTNMVAIIASDEEPPVLLARLKAIERAFGRRRGQRWGARVIDVDIILWSGCSWHDPRLTIPHPGFRMRDFVLHPMVAIAGDWRDPVTGYRVRQLRHRLRQRRRAVDRTGKRS